MWGDRARSALAGTRFGDLRWVPETGSTNADLLALASQGAPDGVVLVADHQSAGRGRMGRLWQAPAGSSLLVSVLFRPRLDPADLHLLTTAVALAALDACDQVASVGVSLKWPNDVVVGVELGQGLRKLAGILAESSVAGGRAEAVVVGIGLNVNWPVEIPEELRGTAVALNHLIGRDVDREDVLIAMLTALDANCADLSSTPEARAALMGRYRHACCTVGQRVRVELTGADPFEGRARSVDDDGRLVVEVDDDGLVGQRTVAVGDVVHLRHRL